MKVFIASDHAAYQEKAILINSIKETFPEVEVEDLGTDSGNSVHYPYYAIDLCSRLAKASDSRGILLCGTGIGMSIVANKFRGIRAALCHSVEDAKLTRQHNDSNILCLGSRTTPIEDLKVITETWLSTPFEGGRHETRLSLFADRGEVLP